MDTVPWIWFMALSLAVLYFYIFSECDTLQRATCQLVFLSKLNVELDNSFIPLACAECDDSLPFSGASSIPLCYVLFPATILYQPFFHPLSPHLAIYFLVYLSILLFPHSYIVPFWEFYFLPFSVHVQTNIIYLTLTCLYYSRFFNTWINFFIG